MRRWNGWGESSITYPLPDVAKLYLEGKLGELVPYLDVPLEDVLSGLPDSRLNVSHSIITTDAKDRLLHARGQSLPDWVALRSGRIPVFPDGVAYPKNSEEVRNLLDYGLRTGTRLIVYGGGTSVVGHINPPIGDTPNISVDMRHINQLAAFDENSHLVTFGAGVQGPDLERALNDRGFTLGHFPQSFEFSTLGGWIATRSSGQQSYHYGRIEELFAGGQLETFDGIWDLPPFPASAAGPDLRHLVLGSEGRLGIVTSATMRIRPLPEYERFFGVFFRNWEMGVQAVRAIAQAVLPVSMLRISDAQETESTLALTGRSQLVDWASRGVSLLGYGPDRCLLISGITGSRKSSQRTLRDVGAIFRSHGGLTLGSGVGEMWRKNRFLAPYMRNTLWEMGVAVDTLETALPWSRVFSTAEAVKSTIANALEDIGERVLVFAHLSHVYRDGASIYVTYLFRRSADPEGTLGHWWEIKSAASQTIIENGGTISHQHGVGVDHAPYLEREKGSIGMKLIKSASQTLDPRGLLNPGKLIDSG